MWWLAPVFVAGAVLTTGAWQLAQRMPDAEADPSWRQQVEEFNEYPLLWLGEEFEGLTLDRVIRQQTAATAYHPAMDSVDFIYGECIPPDDSTPCRNALQITVDGPCAPKLAEHHRGKTTLVRSAVVNVAADQTVRLESDAFSVSIFVGRIEDPAEREAFALRAMAALRGGNALASSITQSSALALPEAQGLRCS